MEVRNRRQQLGKTKNRQTGIALFMMLIFAILMSVQLMSTQLNAQLGNYKTQRQQRLKFAKENLVALAVNYADTYGPSGAGPLHFPCVNQKVPDGSRSSEGPDTPCGSEHFVIGRLPRLVGIDHRQRVLNYQPDQYDSQNALWYIVSTDFVNSPFKKVNAQTQATLTFDSLQDVVAVVLDAGPAKADQANMRPSADFRDYLELSLDEFDILRRNDSNDRYAVITLQDTLPLIFARVSANLTQWLLAYRDRNCSGDEVLEPCFPWGASLPDGVCTEALLEGWIAVEPSGCTQSLFAGDVVEQVPSWSHWFIRNQWYASIRYRVDELCLGADYLECDIVTSTVIYEGAVRPMLAIEPRT